MDSRAIVDSFLGLLAKRELLQVLVMKQLKEKHIGSLLGAFWIVYNALFPLVSAVLVFHYIAKVQVQGVNGVVEYIIFVFSGLVPWLAFSRIIGESCDILNSKLDLLKQAIFPVEIISIVCVVENMAVMAMQLLVVAGAFLYKYPIYWYKIAFLPIYVMCLLLFCLGLSWLLSIIGFFLRDLKDIINSTFQFLFYVTPIAYTRESLPVSLQFLVNINPMTYMIEAFRGLIYYAGSPLNQSFLVFAGLSIGVFGLGYFLILKVKVTIADMV